MLHVPAVHLLPAVEALATGEPGRRLWGAMGWILLMIIIGVVLVLLTLWFKKWLLGQPERTARHGPGFSLHDLRRLRDSGQISPEEYERARDLLVARSHTQGARAAGPEEAAREAVKDVDVLGERE